MSGNIIKLDQEHIYIELIEFCEKQCRINLNDMLNAEADRLVYAERCACDYLQNS